MNLLQTIIPVFYDSNSGPVDPVYGLGFIIATEFCLLLWFIINFFLNRHNTILERLFFDDSYDFPNGPTMALIFFNGLILFLVIVAVIVKLIR